MSPTQSAVIGDRVICSDGEPLGVVERDEDTHLRVRRPESPPIVWVAKSLIAGVSDGMVTLLLPRDDLHDGVIALPPGRQREYGTLETVSLLVRRMRAEHAG